MSLPPGIKEIAEQLDAAERDARTLVDGLTEERAIWRERPGSWSVTECLDHLAATNRIYIAAMQEPAARAQRQGRLARPETMAGQNKPGWIGAWFVRSMEPPVKRRFKAPRSTTPRPSPPLADAFNRFLEAQREVHVFLREHAELDLARVRFPNPFVRGLRFSLATGLHVIPAHERRHLWQAWRTRGVAESVVK